MKLSDFRLPFTGNNIFIKQEGSKNVFVDVKVDYNLSRSLYSSIPLENNPGITFQLGNFCTTPFIDMLVGYIGIPTLTSNNNDYAADFTNWMKRIRSTLKCFETQTLVDAIHYGWMRIEDVDGAPKIVFKQIDRDCVKKDECIHNASGGFTQFVFENIVEWKRNGENKKATIKWTLTPGKERYDITGDIPEGYDKNGIDEATKLKFVPVFEQINKKQSYLNDGIPEIAPAVPFIRRYDSMLRQLGRHVDDGLIPRLIFKIAGKMREFLKLSFGVTDKELDEDGGVTINAEKMENAYLDSEKDSITYLQKEDRTESALKVLELLFNIITELTMPEFMYGSAVSSTNASTKEQSPTWEKKVDGKQGEFDTFFYWLANTYLIMSNQIAGRDVYKDVSTVEIKWPEVNAKDDVALMNALSSLCSALQILLDKRIIGAEDAFNAIKQYMPLSGNFETVQEKANEFQRVTLELENIKERHAQGDVDTGDAINALFEKEKKTA